MGGGWEEDGAFVQAADEGGGRRMALLCRQQAREMGGGEGLFQVPCEEE